MSLKVSLDGENIKDLHIGWLRSQIGVVSQEPILFNTTIAENIRYGREDVTQKEIEEACRQSNAHYFISKLPNVSFQLFKFAIFFYVSHYHYSFFVDRNMKHLSVIVVLLCQVRNFSLLILIICFIQAVMKSYL